MCSISPSRLCLQTFNISRSNPIRLPLKQEPHKSTCHSIDMKKKTSAATNQRSRPSMSKALVYDTQIPGNRVRVVNISESSVASKSHCLPLTKLNSVEAYPEKYTKTGAPGRGNKVEIYLNATHGKNAPVKMHYTTADLSKLDLSTRIQRWRGKFKYIYIHGRCSEDSSVKTSGCFE